MALLRSLYVQVLIAIACGIALGVFAPETGAAMKPLGDGFIRLIKMMIAPIIFCTVVHGIASVGEAKRVGRVAVKALIYFEIVTTMALVLGLVLVNSWAPGAGMNIDPATLAGGAATTEAAQHPVSFGEFLLGLVPASAIVVTISK